MISRLDPCGDRVLLGKFTVAFIFGMIQIIVDLIFELQSGIENKIQPKITGYTVSCFFTFASIISTLLVKPFTFIIRLTL